MPSLTGLEQMNEQSTYCFPAIEGCMKNVVNEGFFDVANRFLNFLDWFAVHTRTPAI
jgi:hypothetical protein